MSIFVIGTYMAVAWLIKVVDFFFGIYVGSISRLQFQNSGTYMCNVASMIVQGHMLIMCSVYTSVNLVTLLIAVSSHKAYILTQLSHISTGTNLHM